LAFVLLFFWITVLATASVYAQVSDSPGSVNCPSLVNLTVTVTTEDGAVIPNAVVILREDTLGEPRGVKVFGGELRTEANGKASAAVDCNYLDVFVGANGFAPAAQKFLITGNAHTLSVPLKMYSITRTTEVPVARSSSSEMPLLPSTKPESPQSSVHGDPVFYIAGPTIFAFSDPEIQSSQKRDTRDLNDAVTAFHYYGQLALQPLARIGVEYREVRGSGFVVKAGDATTSFRSTQAIGCYFVAPAHVSYGVMSDDDLVEAAQKYFGVSQKALISGDKSRR
jgi:hypothetical protein